MNTLLSKLLNNFTMYQVMLYFLRVLIAAAVVLSFFGVLDFTWWHILSNLGLFIVFCVGTNLFFAKLFKVKPNYESQYITAEILTLIVGPLNPIAGFGTIFFISFMAMASKYVLAFNKQHIFNPAAFGVLASALLIQEGASWWIGGQYMLPLVVIGGLLVVQKLRWFHLLISFFTAHLGALIVSLSFQGLDTATIFQALETTILNSALFFFATVMLIEPLTAPRGQNLRMVYGALVGVVIILLQAFWPSYGFSVETGLLLGNIFAYLVSSKSQRQVLKFVEKTQENQTTHSFWFEPVKPFNFIPGQFLEWTLPHKNHDSRGIRRFFTISSSPTEEKIRLVTRYNPKSSTFKQTLMNMKPGEEISVSQLEGEFLLPKNLNDKMAFIAGGVGIAPYLSMIKYLLDKNIKTDIVLFFANKTKDEIAFQDLLTQAESIGVKTVQILNEPPAGWSGPQGFITPELIKKELPDWQTRHYYISGPEPMVLNYLDMIKGMGIPGNRIKRDYFPGYQA